MTRSKLLALLPFVSFAAMFAYLLALWALGDARAQDLRLDSTEMRPFEDVWLAATLVGVIFVWARSLWRSFSQGQIGWAILVLLVWPAAGLYVWKKE